MEHTPSAPLPLFLWSLLWLTFVRNPSPPTSSQTFGSERHFLRCSWPFLERRDPRHPFRPPFSGDHKPSCFLGRGDFEGSPFSFFIDTEGASLSGIPFVLVRVGCNSAVGPVRLGDIYPFPCACQSVFLDLPLPTSPSPYAKASSVSRLESLRSPFLTNLRRIPHPSTPR